MKYRLKQKKIIAVTEDTLQRTKDKWTEAPRYNKCWNLEIFQDNVVLNDEYVVRLTEKILIHNIIYIP